MKRLVTLIAIVLPVFAQEEAKFSQTMKDIASASTQVKKALDAKTSQEDVANGGQKLETLYKDVELFFTKRGMADAVEITKTGQAAAKELGTPSGADAQAALGRLNGTCKTCHAAHREKLPEGGYKIK